MKLELNENSKIKTILEEGIVSDKPSETINLLARYYNKQSMNQEQIVQAINKFMIKNDSGKYNSVTWEDLVEGIVKTVIKNNNDLIEIKEVKITKLEIEYIKSLETEKMQKLIFTYLVYAKIFNQINPKNKNWVKGECRNEVFKDADIKETGKEQLKTIHKLVSLEVLKIAKNITNNSVNLDNVVSDNSEVELVIEDFRELGLQWLRYLGYKSIKLCKCCNKLFKLKSNKQEFCMLCGKNNEKENHNKRQKKYVKQKNDGLENSDK